MANEKDRERALDLAVSQIEKQFGKGSIMKLGEGALIQDVATISTGSLGLDLALGIGGLPRGRIVEIYGPEASGKTTLALQVVAQAQKDGGACAYIDAEHALDMGYAQKLGVKADELLVSQPDNGEQALEITDTLVRSGALDVIVIDSVAALTPRAEIEGEMGEPQMGLQARLMSQALRKLVGSISRSRTLVVFINQVRMKIGVMFGCFHYTTRVTLANGRSEKIGKIVNQRLPVTVLSYDTQTKQLEPRRVVNWFNNGRADHFLQFEIEGGPSGRRRFAVTENHIIFTPSGPRQAGSLQVGDEVLISMQDYVLTDDQLQVVLGGGLGDGSLRKTGAHAAHFRVGHGEAQTEYLRWKQWMLEPFSRPLRPTGRGLGFDTLSMPILADLHTELYNAEGHRIATASALGRLDARGLAVWYGDDGSFAGSYERWGKGKTVLYNKSLSGYAREQVVETFERLGIGRPRDDGRGFWFDAQQRERFHAFIAPYLHPSLEYKLHPSERGRFAWQPDLSDAHLNGTRLASRRRLRAVPARITKRYIKPQTRSMSRFDIEVEGHHTYLVDGAVVHNSPETTTGGNALKFYASVRLDIRRTGAVKQGEEIVGNRTKVKVVKNKVAPPFKEAEFDILYGSGVSKEGELVDIGSDQGIIEKSGAWYSFNSERIGQGRENAKEYLREHPETAHEVEEKVREKFGLTTHGGGVVEEA
jgi:recombination protein RecA